MSELIELDNENKEAIQNNVKHVDFIEIIMSSLIMKEIKEDITIKLTPQINDILNNLLTNTPHLFNEIEKNILEIVKDNKIDVKDIPQFIIMLQKIYHIIYSTNDLKIKSSDCAFITSIILKYIIQLIVLKKIIKIDENKKDDFLKETDLLIDACINLLTFPKSIKVRSCIKKIFG